MSSTFQSLKEWNEISKSSLEDLMTLSHPYLPYVTKENHKKVDLPQKDFIDKFNSWQIISKIAVVNEQEANNTALSQLKNGCTAILFDCEKINNIDFETLLQDIDHTIAPIYLLTNKSNQYKFENSHNQSICAVELDTETASEINENSFFINIEKYKNDGASIFIEIEIVLKLIKTVIEKQTFNSYNIIVFVGYDNLLYDEIAKTKALRYLIKSMAKIYNVEIKLQIIGTNCSYNKSNIDVESNVIRMTIETYAAILGGVDGFVSKNQFSENEEFGLTIAQNIQQLLCHESYFNHYDNPLEGSYFFDTLIVDIIKNSWEGLLEIENLEITLCKKKWEENIAQNFAKKSNQLSTSKTKMVGVNCYPNPNNTISNIINERHLSQIFEV